MDFYSVAALGRATVDPSAALDRNDTTSSEQEDGEDEGLQKCNQQFQRRQHERQDRVEVAARRRAAPLLAVGLLLTSCLAQLLAAASRSRYIRQMSVMLDIDRLTPQERLDLIGELWDSLAAEDVALTPAQEAELARRAAAFDPAHDDLAWAKPYVDEALAEVERGEVVTLEQLEAHLNARFGPLVD
jgi:putative addiction module component (TIGR02574 family)